MKKREIVRVVFEVVFVRLDALLLFVYTFRIFSPTTR